MRLLVGVYLVFATSLARAGDIPPAADIHFKLAQQAYDLGEYKTAIEEYKRTYEIYSNPVLLYSIAQVCRETKDYQCALHFYRQYVERAPTDSKYLATAKEKIAEVEKAVAASVSPPTGPVTPEQETTAGRPNTNLAPGPRPAPLLPTEQAKAKDDGSTTITQSPSVARRWWFWTIVAASAIVIAGVVTIALVATGNKDAPIPATPVGNGVVTF